MDLILALRDALDPLIERTPFILEDVDPLHTGTGGGIGFLEYRGVLNDGRTLLFVGFCQISAHQTITAEMWAPIDTSRARPEIRSRLLVLHYREWAYDAVTDIDVLVRAIVAEVTVWLQSLGQMSEPEAGPPC